MNSEIIGLDVDLTEPKKQQQLIRLMFVATTFFLCSLVYCYVYALVVEGSYLANLMGVTRCVAKDWLVWMIVAPLVTLAVLDFDLRTRRGRLQSLLLVIAATAVLGVARILVEISWGDSPWSHIVVQYVPRYLFITALMASLSLVLLTQTQSSPPPTALPESIPLQDAATENLVVMKGQAVKIIALDDVRYFRSCGNYLDVITEDCCFLQRNTLKNVERQLADKGFIRIHRSYLVNEKCVDCVCGSKGIVYLHDNSELPLGKTYQKDLPHFSGTNINPAIK